MALTPRPTVDIVARDTGDRLQAPRSNAALELAGALASVAPEARQFANQIGAEERSKAEVQARTDALRTSGAAFKDAVTQGLIEKTQNPWYMSAYHKEAAQVDATRRLATLQEEATTWEERSDSALFQDRFNREVGEIGSTYEGEEAKAGFLQAANPVIQQTQAANTARNVATVNAERIANAGALAAQAVLTANQNNGGNASPSQIREALQGQREEFLATGGSESEWTSLMVQSITTAAYNAGDPDLLNVLKSPDLIAPADAGPAPEPTGAKTEGNIDLLARPVTTNADGSVSTVLSMSFGTDAGEVLIPMVADDGTILTEDEAIALYERTGKHLGIFETPDQATAYAEKLHDYQEKLYAGGGRTSLYNRPEVAAAVESDQYRIRQGVIDKLTFEEQSRRAVADADAARLRPLAIEKYGEAVLTGDFDTLEFIRWAKEEGFSYEAAGAAIQTLNRDVQQTQSLQRARFQANALDPSQGRQTLALFTRAATSPLTPQLQSDIETAYIRGDIDLGDATRLSTQAITNGEQLARGSGGGGRSGGGSSGGSDSAGSGSSFRVKSLSGLKETIGQTSAAAYQAIFRVNGRNSPRADAIKDLLEARVDAYLGRNPGDYTGAYADMRQAAASFTTANLQRLPDRRAPRTANPGANTRRQ